MYFLMYICVYVSPDLSSKNERNMYVNMYYYEKLLYLNKILNTTNVLQFTM